MQRRLSLKYNLFQKIILAFALWMVLSLPSPIGLFEFLLIRSPIVFLVLFERAVHFAICFAVINFFLRDKTVLEYTETELIIKNNREAEEMRVPFTKITKLSLQPTKLSFSKAEHSYQLCFLNEKGFTSVVDFKAYSGRRLGAFMELVEKANPDFKIDNWTFH